jgi:hypothetical protein
MCTAENTIFENPSVLSFVSCVFWYISRNIADYKCNNWTPLSATMNEITLSLFKVERDTLRTFEYRFENWHAKG